MTEQEALEEAKRAMRQGMDITDLYEGAEYEETGEGRRDMLAMAFQMRRLISEGYEPPPMPELRSAKRLDNGDLRFLASSDDMRDRAEDALESGAAEDWVFFNGQDDETVRGRVISVEPVHELAYFTVSPKA